MNWGARLQTVRFGGSGGASIPGGSVVQTALRNSGFDVSNPVRVAMMLTVPYYPLMSAGFNTARGMIVR